LHRWEVISARNGVIQNADASDNLFNEFYPFLQSTPEDISGIANECAAFGYALGSFDSNNLAVFKQNLVDICVEHEGATINCTDSGKSFWNTTQTENGVDEGTRIFSH